MSESDLTLTRLLQEARAGDREALNRIVPEVYAELKRIARRQRRARPDASLNTTALVSELYLKLRNADAPRWENRKHFFAAAGVAMRCLLVDSARRRLAGKRGGEVERFALKTGDGAIEDRAEWIVGFDHALSRLAALNPRLASVVELRFLVGLGEQEVADQLGVSRKTVARDWRKARAILSEALSRDGATDQNSVASNRADS